MIKCPYCDSTNFAFLYSTQTAMYVPTIFENGKLVDTGLRNPITYTYQCSNCGKPFALDEFPLGMPGAPIGGPYVDFNQEQYSPLVEVNDGRSN